MKTTTFALINQQKSVIIIIIKHKKGARMFFYKTLKRKISLLCLLIFLCTSGFSMNVYASQTDSGASEADLIGLSFYNASTALTSYVNYVLGPNANDLHNNHKLEPTVTAGNAGAYIGYGDEKNGFYSYITSSLSYGASTSSYNAWLNIIDGADANDAYVYARYGRVLNDAGLDVTGSKVGGATIRNLFGIIMIAVYALSELIPILFSWSFKLLNWLNPFSLLANTISMSNWNLYPAPQGLIASTGHNLVVFVSSLYDQMQNIAWTALVPLFFAVLIFELLLLKNIDKGPKIITFIKRLVFIAIGVPICAGLYTAVLNNLSDLTSTKTAGSQMIVASFIDFEDWVQNAALAPDVAGTTNVLIESIPSEMNDTASGGVSINNQGGSASPRMLRQLRHSVFYLNKSLDTSFNNLGDLVGSETEQAVVGGIWNKNTGGTGFGGTVAGLSNADISSQILSMLQRYTVGSFYRAGDYETTSAGWMTKNYNNELGHTSAVKTALSNQGTIYDMYNQTDSPEDWLDRYQAANTKIFAGQSDLDAIKWGSKPWNIFAYGTLYADGDTGTMNTANSSLVFHGANPGLSKLAMYNYLSTSFDKSSIVTYSPKTSSSENTKQQHYSVNLIGSGVMRYAYGFNLVIVLGVLTLIGFTYSIGMTIKNIKTGIQVLTAIPGASMGVLKSIVQVCVYTITMIAEIIGAGFLYVFISEMFVVIGMAVENAVSFLSFGSINIGGLFANISVLDTTSSVAIMIFIQSLLVLLVGITMHKYNRAYAYAWHKIRVFIYNLVSFKEMQLVVVNTVINDKYYYFIDDIYHSIFEFISEIKFILVHSNHIKKERVLYAR